MTIPVIAVDSPTNLTRAACKNFIRFTLHPFLHKFRRLPSSACPHTAIISMVPSPSFRHPVYSPANPKQFPLGSLSKAAHLSILSKTTLWRGVPRSERWCRFLFCPQDSAPLKNELDEGVFYYTDDQRCRLARKAKRIGGGRLKEIAGLVTSQTLLAGHR